MIRYLKSFNSLFSRKELLVNPFYSEAKERAAEIGEI
jgi:hypothetical protein